MCARDDLSVDTLSVPIPDHLVNAHPETGADPASTCAPAQYTSAVGLPVVTLLGAASVRRSVDDVPLPADRRGCLLAYLAYDGHWVDRDRLALLFWPDAGEHDARRNLRQLLARTRRLDIARGLEATVHALRWPVMCDVTRFRRALGRGDHETACDLWGGPLLEGHNVYDVGAFDAWLEVERERLGEAYHDAVMRASATALDAGEAERAAHRLGRLLELEPLAEDVVRSYLRALGSAGRREAALAAYERFARSLDEELGLEPLPETAELAAQIRSGATASRDRVAPPAATRREAMLTLTPPRLVGRAAEMAALRNASTMVTLVSGEPGVGKSRLLRDALTPHVWAVATEGLDGVPYHPIVALLRQDPSLGDALGPYREDLARLVPELLPNAVPVPLEPATGKARLLEAMALALDAAPGPLVLDDLQWADDATLELVRYLAHRGTRVYGAFRSDEAGPALRLTLDALRGRDDVTIIELPPFSPALVRDLLADLTGRSSGPERFARWLWTRTGGNALIVLETLRALFDAGTLRVGAEGWETDIDDLTSDYGELDVPPAVVPVIQRRLSYLEPATLRVLEAATVVGPPLEARRLAGVVGFSSVATADALDAAERSGFIASGAFRHDLVRQVLGQGIAPERRRVLHALAAEAAAVRDPGVAAEHWTLAGEPARAREAWCALADRWRNRGLQEDAAAFLERALQRCDPGVDRAWLQVTLANVERERGRVERAEALLDDVTAVGHDDARLQVAGAIARAALHLVQGRLADADAVLERSTALLRHVDDAVARLDHVMLRARVAKQLVRTEEAIALLAPEVERLREEPASVRHCQFVTSLAALYDDVGRNEEALPLHREAFDLAAALGARYHQVDIATNLVFCLADLGRLDEAFEVGSEALGLGAFDNVAVLRNNVASVAFSAGRHDEALDHYEPLQREVAQPYLRAIALARSAEACAALGRHAAVPDLIDQALDALANTDYPVAVAAVVRATLALGGDDHVGRLRLAVPTLEAAAIPAHQRDAVARLWRQRLGVTLT